MDFRTWCKTYWKKVLSWVGIVVLAAVSLALVFNQPIANWLLENQSGQVVKPSAKANYNYGQM